jgi:hypothetical protein
MGVRVLLLGASVGAVANMSLRKLKNDGTIDAAFDRIDFQNDGTIDAALERISDSFDLCRTLRRW